MTATLGTGPVRLGDPTQSRHDANAKKRHLAVRLLTHLCVLVGVVLSIFPFYWLLVMSTNTTGDIFGFPPKLTFGPHLMENVRNVIANVDLLQALANTFFVSLSCAVLVMFFDSLAAFAFAKYDFPGKNVLFVTMLATFLVPGSLSLVPSFILMSQLGWIGELQALIIPGAANAFGIFLLRQFAASSIPTSWWSPPGSTVPASSRRGGTSGSRCSAAGWPFWASSPSSGPGTTTSGRWSCWWTPSARRCRRRWPPSIRST